MIIHLGKVQLVVAMKEFDSVNMCKFVEIICHWRMYQKLQIVSSIKIKFLAVYLLDEVLMFVPC